ncbi:MAG TPA: adenylate kinase [Candidatus Limnocylindria bacterium]
MTQSVSAPDTASIRGTSGDLIIMGPPGVGKGTQAKALAQQNRWVQLSTGEVFRDHIRRQTDLGRRVKGYLEHGEYVPDDVTIRMVRAKLEDISPSTRVLFDGFPRTVAQADALDRLSGEMGRQVGAVLLLDAPREELLARLNGRATAEHRADDTPEIIANRLEVYEEQTRPVISYYEDRGLVRRVSAVGSVPEITARLREAAE